MLNVTATGNAVRGGTGSQSCSCGQASGLGAVLFNLNGTVTIDFSTFAGNILASNNGTGDKGSEDATVYSLAYGDKIEDGTASSATLTIHNSIIHGTHADGGDGDDVLVNVVNGAHANTSGIYYAGKNFIGQSHTTMGVTQSGTSPNTGPPLLGALSVYRASANVLDAVSVVPAQSSGAWGIPHMI
jgi:hypothetical protein